MTYESTYFLVSLADMQTYIFGSDTPSVGDSAMLGNIEACVTYWMERYTRRKLKARDLTEYYDGNGRSKILLNQWPIWSTTSTMYVYDDTGRTFASTSMFDSDDFVIYADEGIVGLLNTTFSVGLQNVKVVYNAGYGGGTPAATIPYDLVLATYELTGFTWQRMKKQAWETTGATLMQGGFTLLDASAPRTVREILDDYKRRMAA